MILLYVVQVLVRSISLLLFLMEHSAGGILVLVLSRPKIPIKNVIHDMCTFLKIPLLP